MYELIICEKPNAAKKIAEALADKKPVKKSEKGVPCYELQHNKKDIVVACAVGHLFGLDQKSGKKSDLPVFNIEWFPTSDISKSSAFTKKYLSVIKKLAKNASSFVVATDYDVEGEVIGLNIIRHACKKKDAKRMKFSTLTKEELIKAYENSSPHLDWGQANAGVARHKLDWFYGINTSRALTHSITRAGFFKLLSSGRVQGPALKLMVDKEKEIKAFRPAPYWQISLLGKAESSQLTAWHETDKFWKKQEADAIYKKTKTASTAQISSAEKKKFQQFPPNPFDLTSLQIEAHRCFGLSPKITLEIAQDLYTNGFISYPRTSSQILPKEIGYSKIIRMLSRQREFVESAKSLLRKKSLVPNNGKKTDPAHPAVFPTGLQPDGLDHKLHKIYDLVVRRFLAAFGDPALRETTNLKINCNNEIFIAKGTTTLERGWHSLYGKYASIKEDELPKLDEGDKIKVIEITLYDKETQPPPRYTEASIVKELEKRNLGTKCLTSNTLVKINSNNKIHNEKIAELFDSLYGNTPINAQQSMGIAINNKKTCFSFNEFDEIRSHFILASKRKLNKDEKVYRIEYKDGSYIELTENHPLLIFQDNSCEYITVKNIKKGMKSVASVKFPEKQRDIIRTWEDFLKKCNIKTKLYAISDEILTKRKKQGLSQHSFGRKFDLQQPQIRECEKSKNVPLYIINRLNLSKPKKICSVNKNVVIKNPFPLRMSSPLARIFANLVGDASVDSKRIERENCYDFRYHNTNFDLIYKFIEDIKSVFGVQLYVKLAKSKKGHLPKYYVRIPAVIGRIISILFSEVIKKNAVKIPQDFYPEFIGSLFDDEGHSMKSEPKLFISNTNFKLLEDVKQMLETLGMKASLEKKQFKLYIRGRGNIQKFLEKIPFASIEKKKRLVAMLSKFYRFGKGNSSLQKQLLLVSALNSSANRELTNRELSEKVGFNMPKSKHHLNLLIKNSYIGRITKGVSKYPRKKISYQLTKLLEETFFKYVGEEVISSDFITKTINSVKEIDYNGYVYDITNNEENPNFILANGVVVHNSTRANIIDTLFQRGYVDGKPIQATKLGIMTNGVLETYSPKLTDEALTRHFEEEMESIYEKKQTEEHVLAEARKAITDIISDFKKNEKQIGEELKKANLETRDEMSILGKCPVCKQGDLMIRRGKYGGFVACNQYPGCKTIFSLPGGALIRPAKKQCPQCSFPMVLSIRKGKRPQELCFNPKCPSKKETKKVELELKKLEAEQRPCPKCKQGVLVVKRSAYGYFLACNKYPKCRYTENIQK